MMGSRDDEMVGLAGDCGQTADKLKLLVETQQHLIHEIAHELRSPLMRMQAAIGLLRQDPACREMVDRIERESVRMDTLIEALLTLARLQSYPGSIQREPLDVIELLTEITEDAQFEAGLKGCKVSLKTCPAFVSCVSGELLYRSFENVIRNAVRHTRSGTTVAVSARINPDAGCLNVWITDQGRGIANERLHSIFQPFERGLSEAGTGFGLGLAIAARAVEIHGGVIIARNELSGGLTVEISLPCRA